MKWIIEAESIDDVVQGRYAIKGKLTECKDCKFCTSINPYNGIRFCDLTCRYLSDDGFCSEAKRRVKADYTGLAVEDVKKVTDEVIKELKNDYKKALDCILTAYLNPDARHNILEKFVFETFSVGEEIKKEE